MPPRELLPSKRATLPLFAGIDVGGTNIKIGVVDSTGQTLAYSSDPTEVEEGPTTAVERMVKTITSLCQQSDIDFESVVAIGLATPGSMDVPTGMLLEPHNLPGWWNFPIRDELRTKSKRHVVFANDANAAAFGEFWNGTGKQANSMIMLTLGTGIGGGIVLNGKLLTGEHSCGGEVGHIIIDCQLDATEGDLGNTGSLEAYASAAGVVSRARRALAGDSTSTLHKRVADGSSLTPLVIAEEANNGDTLAWDVIARTAEYLAVGIVSLVHTIDPQSVVLGGAMTFGGSAHPLGERFLSVVRTTFDSRVFPVLSGKIQIDFASLGGDAGYVGAAGLAQQDFCEQT